MHVAWDLSQDGSMLKLIPLRFSLTRRALSRVAVLAVTGLTLAACSSSAAPIDATASETSASVSETETVSTLTSVLTATDTTQPPAPSTDDVFTTIEATGSYPTFVKLVNQAGLADTLSTGGPFTIAVPSEAAFTALPSETLSSLGAGPVELARLLKYHVVPGLVSPDPASSGPSPTLEGSTLDVQFTETDTTINGAQVLTPPRATANGAYIEINKVLIPPAKQP
jgi:uncharacterized surface protein with fasciclin (FAS1) repeats